MLPSAGTERIRYADHVDEMGVALFEQICELDLEGIVAKLKSDSYVSERERSTWVWRRLLGGLIF